MPLTLTKHLQSQTKDQSQAKKEDILLKSSKQAVHMLFCHCYFVEVILVAGKRQCLPFHFNGASQHPLTLSTSTAAKKGQIRVKFQTLQCFHHAKKAVKLP